MARTPAHNDRMTRKELDIGDSDLSLDPSGMLDDPDEGDLEPEDPETRAPDPLDPRADDAKTPCAVPRP